MSSNGVIFVSEFRGDTGFCAATAVRSASNQSAWVIRNQAVCARSNSTAVSDSPGVCSSAALLPPGAGLRPQRRHQAVTRNSRFSVEKRKRRSVSSTGFAAVVCAVLRCSGIAAGNDVVPRSAGQFEQAVGSHSGPYHHKVWTRNSEGDSPRDAQSTGLSFPGMWCHRAFGTTRLISATLLAT